MKDIIKMLIKMNNRQAGNREKNKHKKASVSKKIIYLYPVG